MSPSGTVGAEAADRRATFGPNAFPAAVSAWTVLRRQLGSTVLLLLAAIVSAFLGDVTQSVIIRIILVIGVGPRFVSSTGPNALPKRCVRRVQHSAVVRRDGAFVQVDVVDLTQRRHRLTLRDGGARRCPGSSTCRAWNATKVC